LEEICKNVCAYGGDGGIGKDYWHNLIKDEVSKIVRPVFRSKSLIMTVVNNCQKKQEDLPFNGETKNE